MNASCAIYKIDVALDRCEALIVCTAHSLSYLDSCQIGDEDVGCVNEEDAYRVFEDQDTSFVRQHPDDFVSDTRVD